LDGSISKGTGLPVENGLMPNEAEDLLSVILQDEKVVCFEITELNPGLDINSTTIDIVFKLLETAVDILKTNKRLY
jgi:arginase